MEHFQVDIVLGTPLKGFGETNRRGRSRHVRYYLYVIDFMFSIKSNNNCQANNHHQGRQTGGIDPPPRQGDNRPIIPPGFWILYKICLCNHGRIDLL